MYTTPVPSVDAFILALLLYFTFIFDFVIFGYQWVPVTNEALLTVDDFWKQCTKKCV